MRRRVRKVLVPLVGALLLVVAGLVIRARWIISRNYAHIPLVPIAADRSEAGVKRGEMLFQSLCLECHGGADGRATGKRLAEVPAFLGTFFSANLAHPERGVHRRSDGELARTLRSGVLPDGRFSPPMGSFARLGDTDVAAILGYLRSSPPALVPGGPEQPRSEISLLGQLILTVIAGVQVEAPRVGIPVPTRAPTIEYGRYMVQIMDCAECHTEGFSSDKMTHPSAFAGGFELTDPTGVKIWSKNITPDEATGIGRWSLEDFERAVTRGVTHEGYMVRKPMPLYARFERVEVEAIYRFLRTVPGVNRTNAPGGHPLQKPRPSDSPEVLFVKVGCAACHGESAPYRDKIRAALTKSDAEVASWILDPQSRKPGSTMPSFQHALDGAQAEQLAQYVKSIASSTGG